MKVWIPTTAGHPVDYSANRAAAGRLLAELEPLETPGIAVRFRFVHKLPAGPLAVRPEMPGFPSVPLLVWEWARALDGLLWADNGLVVSVTARREWGRVSGVEVIV